MRKHRTILFCVAAMLCLSVLPAGAKVADSAPYQPVNQYDPKRDAEKDINDAIAEAKRTGKNVLLEVGADWCAWCKTMDTFYADHPQLKQLKARHYVAVKINSSPENPNTKTLARYPKGHCIPQLIVLDKNGKFLHSQDTCELESGKNYDLEKFKAFLNKWVP
jgi:thiol:disulfide interchange protein